MLCQAALPVVVALICLCCSSENHSRQSFTAADVDAALRDAQDFKEAGKYAQALERHIWYHENALKYSPAQYGVRLSFALASWVELGKDYPKALDALRTVRDKELQTYRADPTDALKLNEVMSINTCLEDWQSVKELFYESQKHGIECDLTSNLDDILGYGDVTWAKDVLGDPAKAVEEIQIRRDDFRHLAKTYSRKGLSESSLDGSYAMQLVNIIKAVDKIYGRSQAVEVQKAAVLIVDLPIVRDALSTDESQ